MKKLIIILLFFVNFAYSQDAQLDYKDSFGEIESRDNIHVIVTYTDEEPKNEITSTQDSITFQRTGIKVIWGERATFYPYDKIVKATLENDHFFLKLSRE